MDQVLRRIIVGGLYLTPFIPLIVLNMLAFPTVSGKALFFMGLIELLFALYVTLALLNRSYQPRFSFIFILLTGLLGLLALVNLFGIDPTRSFFGTFERMEGWVLLVHLFLYFVMAGSVLSSREWGVMLHLTVVASVLLAVIALFQFGGVIPSGTAEGRVDATLGNAGQYAGYALIHLLLSLYLLVRSSYNRYSYFYGAALVLNLTALFLTGTRGALIALAGSVVIYALLMIFFGKAYPRARKGALGLLLVLILLSSLLFAFRTTSFVAESPYLSRAAEIMSLEVIERENRYFLWRSAWEGFLERPLLGWGQENYLYVHTLFYQPELYNNEPWVDRAHNAYLEWLVAGGLVTLTLYLLIWIMALRVIWRHDDLGAVPARGVLAALLGGYAVHLLFLFDSIVTYLFFFSFLAYLHFLVSQEKAPLFSGLSILQGRFAVPTLTGVLALAIPIIYFSIVPSARASYELVHAVNELENPKQALRFYREGLSRNTAGDTELRLQLMRHPVAASQLETLPPELRRKWEGSVKDELAAHLEMAPEDVRVRYQAATFLLANGNFAEAREIFEDARSRSPKHPLILFGLARAHLALKEVDVAQEQFRFVYELTPNYLEAARLYAISSILSGDLAEADALLTSTFHTTLLDDDELLNAYLKIGAYDRVARILEARALQNPGNANLWVQLAAAYFEAGDRGKSIAAIEKAIEAEPRFRAQGDVFIRDIRAGRRPQ